MINHLLVTLQIHMTFLILWYAKLSLKVFFVQNYFDQIKGHVEETHDNFVVCKNDHILSSDGQLAILNICNLYFKNQIKCNQKSKWFGFRLFSLSISIVLRFKRAQFLGLKRNLNKIIIKLINPRREHPVSSAQIPKVPPKLAILSVVVVRTSNLLICTSELLYRSLTMMMLFMKFWAILKYVEDTLLPLLKP